MACIISISSDEEEFEDGRKSFKKIKLNCPKEKDVVTNNIIVLEDEYDNKGAKLRNICAKVKSTGPLENPSKMLSIEKRDGTELKTLAEMKEMVEETQSLNSAKKCFAENATENCEIIESENRDLIQSTVQNVFQSSIQINQNPNDNLVECEESIKPGPSSCEVTDNFKNCKKMQELVDVCLAQIKNPETRSLFKSKIPVYKKLFSQVDEDYIKSEEFIKELEEKITLSKMNSYMAVQNFNDIYKLLKAQKKYASSDISNTDTQHRKIIMILEDTLSMLQKRIKELSQEEVNFDEEEDSCYIKLFRYQERAVKVYEKLCKYQNEDPHYDSIMHNRLDFSGSRLPEFNEAINRKYKNNIVFPTYYELECYLRKCVNSNNMEISESAFKVEARQCFEKLGNLIQYRRKMDLLDVHSFYVPSNQDPATDEPELNSKLQSHYENAQSKRNEIFKKYSRLQDTGENPDISTDSDDSNDSNIQQSEDETEK